MSAEWPAEAIAKIEHVVGEWNEEHAEHAHIRLAWREREMRREQEELSGESGDFQEPAALVSFLDKYFELRLSKCGDPDYPDSCQITTSFKEWAEEGVTEFPLLPTDDIKKLYNVMRNCKDNVTLSLLPDSRPSILIVGLATTVPLETLTPRILHDALFRLTSSTELVMDWLLNNKGDDHWSMDGGNE